MATVRRSLSTRDHHQLFRGVFDEWLSKADALSALPDAPVVPDEPRTAAPGTRDRLTRDPWWIPVKRAGTAHSITRTP